VVLKVFLILSQRCYINISCLHQEVLVIRIYILFLIIFYYFLRISSWLFGCLFLFYQDFSLIRFWCCLVFISVSLLPFSFINFNQNSLFSFFKYLLFQELFSLLLLFSWFFNFLPFLFIVIFSFFKIGIAPLAFWLEKIILEIKEGVFWLLTLPKVGPSAILFTFSNSFSVRIILLFSLFSFIKLFSVKNFLIILLYLGNFSIFFGRLLRIMSFTKRMFWIFFYLITNFIVLLSLDNQYPDIFFFLLLSPLPPIPFFFLKIYLFWFFGIFSIFSSLTILIFSIILFYCIWELSSTSLFFFGEFFFYKKFYFLYCFFFCTIILLNFFLL
jgi:hypothetical protein